MAGPSSEAASELLFIMASRTDSNAVVPYRAFSIVRASSDETPGKEISMLLQVHDAVISPFRFLLFSGGLPLLAPGVVFSFWGLWNILKPRHPGLIVSQMLLSLLPGIFAMIAIYVTYTEFAAMAAQTTIPKPTTLAGVAGSAMSYGFCGLLSTITPVILGAVAMHRYLGLPGESSNGPAH